MQLTLPQRTRLGMASREGHLEEGACKQNHEGKRKRGRGLEERCSEPENERGQADGLITGQWLK